MIPRIGEFTVSFSGKFDDYFEGTGCGQGQGYDDNDQGSVDLYERYRAAVVTRRGRGRSVRLDRLTRAAVECLADYADTCIDCNLHGDRDAAEIAAARRVLADCKDLLAVQS